MDYIVSKSQLFAAKRLVKRVLISLLLLFVNTVFSQTTADIYVISPIVGDTIDAQEKIKFGLFPFYKRSDFQYGVFYQLSDSTYLLKSLVKDSAVEKVFNKELFLFYKNMIEGPPTKTESERDSKLLSISSAIDTSKVYFIELKDGIEILGSVIQKNATSITVKTTSDRKLEILISEIKSISDNSVNNAIYGNLGGSIGGPFEIYMNIALYYERILNQDKGIKTFVKVGLGGYAVWGEGGVFLLGHYGVLTGRKSSHLEISAGANLFLSGDMSGFNYFKPIDLLSGTIGYRYQKTKKSFIFRTGVSWPEMIYIGVGRRF